MKYLDTYIVIMIICAVLCSIGSMISKDIISIKNIRIAMTNSHDVNIKKAVDESNVISTILQNLMESENADRAYLFEFHNGSYSISGKPFCYYSNTHETVRNGISAEIMNLQKLPISLLSPSWLPKLIKNKPFIIETSQEPHEQSRRILESQGIKEAVIGPILYQNKIIGFIGIDYVTMIPKNIDVDAVMESAIMIKTMLIGKEE